MCKEKQLAAQEWGHQRDAGKALPLLDASLGVPHAALVVLRVVRTWERVFTKLEKRRSSDPLRTVSKRRHQVV